MDLTITYLVSKYECVYACSNDIYHMLKCVLMIVAMCFAQNVLEHYNNPCLEPGYAVISEVFELSNRYFHSSV